jgi:translation initiation factor IF-1
VGVDPPVMEVKPVEAKLEAKVIEEMPSLVYRLELNNKAQVLAHGAGAARRNWVRLLPGDRVEVELGEHDPTRGRIVRKI